MSAIVDQLRSALARLPPPMTCVTTNVPPQPHPNHPAPGPKPAAHHTRAPRPAQPLTPTPPTPSPSRSTIWYNWLVIQGLLFCLAISACAAAADSDSSAYGFFVVWTTMLAVAYSVFGTFVLRRVEWRTPLNVGVLLGVGVCMINFMLGLAVLSGGAGGWVHPETYSSVRRISRVWEGPR